MLGQPPVDRPPGILGSSASNKKAMSNGEIKPAELQIDRTTPTDDLPTAGSGRSWQQSPSSVSQRSSALSAKLPKAEEPPKFNEIAKSLSSRDPSWFRQTPDRGSGSPALRKHTNGGQPHLFNQRLPGMTQGEKEEQPKANGSESLPERSRSPSRTSSAWGENPKDRFSSVSSISTAGGLGSPVPLSSSHKLEPRPEEGGADDLGSPSSSSPQTMSARSTSPTKGLGGFVQSAMMKRSDTVSKRWSAQSSTNPGRISAVATGRTPVTASAVTSSAFGDLSSKAVHGSSPQPSPRPGSSYGEGIANQNGRANNRPKTPPVTSQRPDDTGHEDGGSQSSMPLHTRSGSNGVMKSGEQRAESPTQTPASPMYSRTMDPKRWSPTKASWLESALNRPDSPKQVKKPSSQTQPSWMRDRQAKGSLDLGRPSSFKEVTPVGLMRSPPPGAHFKKSSISGFAQTVTGGESTKVVASSMALPAAEKAQDSVSTTTKETNISNSDKQQSEEQKPSPSLLKSTSSDALSSGRKQPPPVLSPKPQGLPLSPSSVTDSTDSKSKVDFRGNLKRREQVKDEVAKEEPEFKNVFGKLKRAQTSNYVAPDELKGNIVRGKAALNVTGGYKKSPRVDEFKESILKQKEAMKAGGGSVRRGTGQEKEKTPAHELSNELPEAIARRNQLAKPTALSGRPLSPAKAQIPGNLESPPPHIHAVNTTDSEKLDVLSRSKTTSSASSADVEISPVRPDHSEGSTRHVEPQSVEQETKLISIEDKEIKPVRALPPPGSEPNPKAAPVNIGGLDTKGGALAGRVNPALAGILSRGPPGAGSALKNPMTTGAQTGLQPSVRSQSNSSAPSTPLTHMTKARARGPKRRLPNASGMGLSVSNLADDNKTSATPKTVNNEASASLSGFPSSKPAARILTKPSISLKSAGASQDSRQPAQDRVLSREEQNTLPRPDSGVVEAVSKVSVSQSLEADQKRRVSDKQQRLPPKPTFSSVSSSGSVPLISSPRAAATSSLASSTASRADATEHKDSSRVSPSTEKPSIAIGMSKPRRVSPLNNKISPSPPVPPKIGNLNLERQSVPQLDKRSSLTHVPLSAESIETITRFFATVPKSSDRVDIDPQLMLAAKPGDVRIHTVRRQIWEISSDGKRQDLPANQEYILYEGSMYVCVHGFETEDGSPRSEVHMWCGDDVSEAALEDAQLFARKVARENGCKLELLRQGNETATFIQGLGGILITRRGPSSRSSSSATYMLCGRRHLRQMAFDEVDLSQMSLCSGYPFVISTRLGPLYLWKGKGSGAEEIGAARLIGMDLGSTDEIVEICEGEEPDAFFEIFPENRDSLRRPRAEYWSLKPGHEHFGTRLLRIDHELGQRSGFWIRRPGSPSPVVRPNDTVQEIEPFSQKDLSPRSIYLLDTFFEIYV